MVPGWLLLWQFTAKAVVEQKLVEFCPCGAVLGHTNHAPTCPHKPTPTQQPRLVIDSVVCDRFHRGACTHWMTKDGDGSVRGWTRSGRRRSHPRKTGVMLRCGCSLETGHPPSRKRDIERTRKIADMLGAHQARKHPCQWHTPRPCCYNAVAHVHYPNGPVCYLACEAHDIATRDGSYGLA